MKIQNNKTKEENQKMKIQNKKLLPSIVFVTSVLMAGATLSPAFATSSLDFGPWSKTYESPSFHSSSCTGTSNACADAATTGVDKVIARANGFYASNSAIVANNEDFSSLTVGSSPTLTTSVSTVYFKVSATYNGYLTIASGASATYRPEMTMWDSNGELGSCTGTNVSSAGLSSSTVNVSCTWSNSGSHTFYLGEDHYAQASDGFFGGQTTTDFWNSPHHATTNWLEICDYNC